MAGESVDAVNRAPLRFSNYGLEEGLSQHSVTSIVQDQHGFLWVGTQDGLNRFDGYDFRIFRHQPGDSFSLSNSYINDLLLDRNGNLWVGTFNGFNRYDPYLERFARVPFSVQGESRTDRLVVRDLLEDSSGLIWLGTSEGLIRYDSGNGEFSHLFISENPPEADLAVLAEDDQGRIWIGARKGLRILEPLSGALSWADELYAGLEFLREERIRALLIDDQQRIWVGTSDLGVLVIDQEKQSWRSFRSGHDSILPHDQVSSLGRDDQGLYWIGTLGGLLIMDPDLEVMDVCRQYADDPYSLSQSTVTCFFQDAGGQIWLGTNGGGLNRHDPGTRVFNHWRSRAAEPGSLKHAVVYSLLVDSRGTLWVGTLEGGLNYLDRDSGLFSALVHDPARPDSISSNHVVAIAEGLDGVLWVATSNAGLNRLDPGSGRFTRISGRESGGPLSSDRLRALAVDRFGAVWIGTSGFGLDRYEPKSGRVRNFKKNPQDPSSLSNDFVRGLHLDISGDLWVATYGRGINRLSLDDFSIKSWVHDPKDPSSLSSDLVRSIFQDSRGRYWISTDLGLNRFDPEKGDFTRHDTRHGLPSNVVYGVLEDREGLLWMSTNQGVARFDPQGGVFTVFDQHDGLQSSEFNTGAYCRDAAGNLYFGGQNGFNVFDPGLLKPNHYVPPVVFTDLLVFNEPVAVAEDSFLPVSLVYAGEVRFDSRRRIISFQFAGLSFRQARKHRYAFKLEGFQDRWIETSAGQRQATFSALPPGRYLLRVRSANEDGVWNKNQAMIKVVIVPGFRQTLWFRILVLLGLAALVISVFIWRQADLRRRNLLLERTVQERTEEILRQKGEIEDKSREIQARLQEVEDSVAQIKRLEGLLPICCSCKKIRLKDSDSKNRENWLEVEDYIAERTDADFSHGICPDCADKYYPGRKKT